MARFTNIVKMARDSRLFIPILLIAILIVGGTLALLLDRTDEVKNTFTPSTAEIEIDEDFDGEEKSNVVVQNKDGEDAVDVYVRVLLVYNWYRDSENGTILVGKSNWDITDKNYVLDKDNNPIPIFNSGTEDSKWIEGADGYWYYKDVLEVGAYTDNLINRINLLSESADSTYQGLEIIAEGIQADGGSKIGTPAVWTPAVVQAWDNDKINISVNDDGTLNVTDAQ